jgi:hypothetical protein
VVASHSKDTLTSLSPNMGGFLFKKPDDVPGAAFPAIMVGMFVAFGGILFGYDV